jgi:hypothetical protein
MAHTGGRELEGLILVRYSDISSKWGWYEIMFEKVKLYGELPSESWMNYIEKHLL